MTDPIYGDQPQDPEDTWFRSMRPPLVNDPEIRAWQAVISAAMLELLDSGWSVRWRTKSPVTALGAHLTAMGAALGFPRPDGWDDDRYQPVVVALDGAVGTRRGKPVTAAIADALAQPGQTWQIQEHNPLAYTVAFFGITDDEAMLYSVVLDRGRPKGVGYQLLYSTEPAANVWTFGVSELGGTDGLADYA